MHAQDPTQENAMRHRLTAVLAAACIAAPLSAFAQSAAAPNVAAGESWTYREINNYNRLPVGDVVREVSAAGDEIRIVSRMGGAELTSGYSRPGLLASGTLNDRATGTMTPSLDLMPFPLEPGQRWSQTVQRRDPLTGEVRNVRVDGRVIGWETVRVPAGEFRALKVERRMWLGDWDQFRGETWRAETEWFVPELKGAAKLVVFEEYPPHRYSLTSFMPGTRVTYELTGFKRS
jgi:hypothetical protein